MTPVDWSKTCIGCQYCCTYVSLEIDAPKTDADHDVIRWYLAHRNISIYIGDDDLWYFLVDNACENLSPQGCLIYEDRFQICRHYEASKCEMTLGIPGEKLLFRTVEDYDRWLEFKRVRKEMRGGAAAVEAKRNGSPGKRTIKGHPRPLRPKR